ncbi:MAG: FumA C-terminus/TtdB family hydratase beta subunit [Chloroflexota bacterium]|nr:FumA C-terminus/TtdB family hydratase beta subunit [Chloroflexota bacterium]
MATYELNIPISEEDIRILRVGDAVRLSGVMVTGRDAAHKYLIENFIRAKTVPESERSLYDKLQRLLKGSVIYHCGPVVRQDEDGRYHFVAAGPTTSIREEVYEPEVIAHFGLRGVVGKGGMGSGTLRACKEHGAVYFHAIGGAASLIADAVKEVVAVYKKDEFGVPEAFWVIRVENFPVVVTMDTYGRSIHDEVEAASREALERLM